jgi:hypothetical protein
MTKETAKERRARETREAQEAEARWEAEKPMRLLTALAHARDLGIETAYVHHRHDVMCYAFTLPSGNEFYDTVAELSEHVMLMIERDLNEVVEERARRERLYRLKEEVLARLSPEEREALGFDQDGRKHWYV